MCARVHSQDAQLWKGGGELGHGFQKSTHICAQTYLRPRTYIHVSAAVSRDRGGLRLSTTSYWQKKTEQSFHTTCSAARRPKAAQDAPPPQSFTHSRHWSREPRQQKSDHYPLRATSRLSNQFPSETSHSSPPQACCGKMWRFGGSSSTDAQPGGTSWAQTQLQGQKVL